MPKSILGKFCLVMLGIFFVQFVSFLRMASINFLGAIVQWFSFTPFTSIAGIILSVMSLKKEKEKRIVIITTLTVSIVYFLTLLLFFFGFSFGG
ncbi:hypothetical protein LCL89_05545 [Halobacillus yeomjeoni]|uniref:hypothetical protein n=1 Tax=Halobacillus yeomjeoni TaxID=311194 RepID=UPI001CD3A93B|nr:hypothetical protein [Halobacillus yeomjeoni]MCA0983516.1 hypothetical protein [Halobacillus yeomjeoni]